MCFTIGLENKFVGGLTIKDITTSLNDNKIFYSIYYTKNNEKIFIKTFLDDDNLIKTVCNLLCEYIFENYINDYVCNYIDNYYSYFSGAEKAEISKQICDKKEKNFVKKKLFDYFSESDSLLVEGFVNFRLKEYLNTVSSRIEVIVEDMLIKKEYYEFIGFLRYFVNMQNSKCNEVNIVKYKNGSYDLFDENKKIIENNSKQEFMFEIADEEFCINDVLINDLVNLSPKKVIIHNKENFETKEILKTVESIFENSFFYCNGCDLCKNID